MGWVIWKGRQHRSQKSRRRRLSNLSQRKIEYGGQTFAVTCPRTHYGALSALIGASVNRGPGSDPFTLSCFGYLPQELEDCLQLKWDSR